MNNIYIFGHQNPDTDTIVSAMAWADLNHQLGNNQYVAARLGKLSRETQFVLDRFKLDTPELLTDATGKQVVLVDHNDFKQSAPNIDQADILAIVDHHRIAGIETAIPLYITMEPLGSTASIIYKKYEHHNLTINPAMAGGLLSAIISDTLGLTSPTTTSEDEVIAADLANIAGVDIKTYGDEMLRAGASLEGFTPADIFGQDRKRFDFADTGAYVGQVFTFDVDQVLTQKAQLLATMQAYIDANDASLAILAITNLGTNDSTLYACGRNIDVAHRAFNFTGDETFLPGVVSRKSQLVPPLTAAVKNL